MITLKKKINFARLPESIEGYLRASIINPKLLRIKYWQNKTQKVTKKGWRYIKPLRLYSKNGVRYCLALYLNGASVSNKGLGYRLFLVDRIRAAEYAESGVDLFKKINHFSKHIKISHLDSIFQKLLYAGEIED